MTIEERIQKYKVTDWVADLMRKTGRSQTVIYNIARKLKRQPTVDEILNRTNGRPKKYL
jgi:hypothetical protein